MIALRCQNWGKKEGNNGDRLFVLEIFRELEKLVLRRGIRSLQT